MDGPDRAAPTGRSPWRIVAIVATVGLVVGGVVLAATPGDPAPPPTVERSVSTAVPLLDDDVLRAVYDDSMRQLRECIDDHRSDPEAWSESAGASFPC